MANTPEFDALMNHVTACDCCHPMHEIYCAEGRNLWIDDKAAFIANLETKSARQYWLEQVKKNHRHYAAMIEKRTIDTFNAKRI